MPCVSSKGNVLAREHLADGEIGLDEQGAVAHLRGEMQVADHPAQAGTLGRVGHDEAQDRLGPLVDHIAGGLLEDRRAVG